MYKCVHQFGKRHQLKNKAHIKIAVSKAVGMGSLSRSMHQSSKTYFSSIFENFVEVHFTHFTCVVIKAETRGRLINIHFVTLEPCPGMLFPVSLAEHIVKQTKQKFNLRH